MLISSETGRVFKTVLVSLAVWTLSDLNVLNLRQTLLKFRQMLYFPYSPASEAFLWTANQQTFTMLWSMYMTSCNNICAHYHYPRLYDRIAIIVLHILLTSLNCLKNQCLACSFIITKYTPRLRLLRGRKKNKFHDRYRARKSRDV